MPLKNTLFKMLTCHIITGHSASFSRQKVAAPRLRSRAGEYKTVMSTSLGAKGLQDFVIAMEMASDKITKSASTAVAPTTTQLC
jgi:hypothetical protein